MSARFAKTMWAVMSDAWIGPELFTNMAKAVKYMRTYADDEPNLMRLGRVRIEWEPLELPRKKRKTP